jgi:putative membrane protein
MERPAIDALPCRGDAMNRIWTKVALSAVAATVMMLPVRSYSQATDDDKKFLANVSQAGVNEIKLSQLAEEKASDPRVKEFAHKMVTEHTALGKSLQPYADNWGVPPAIDLDDSHKSDYEKLNGLSGKDFDKEYIADMVSDHDKAESLFKSEIKDTKDMKFRATVQSGYSHVVAHYNMAKSLKKEL